MLPARPVVLEQVAAGDDVPLQVARDLVGQPLRVRYAADHHEQRRREHVLDGVVRAIGERDAFE
jgi:hypothetical protein